MSQLSFPTVSAETLDAVISDDGLYRYYLERRLPPLPEYETELGFGVHGWLCFVMLNPSTADHTVDDPTIRKCKGFAYRLGFRGIRVVNLYAFRTSSPVVLTKAHHAGTDIVGPDADRWIRHAFDNSSSVAVAWGQKGPRPERIGRIVAIATEMKIDLHSIGVNSARDTMGQPKHPLMTAYKTPMTRWSPPA